MSTNDSQTLSSCPFCGGEAEFVDGDYNAWEEGYAVRCRNCSLTFGATGRLGEPYQWSCAYRTEADAAGAWNTRAAAPACASAAGAIAELRRTVRDAFSREEVSILVEGHAIMLAIAAVEDALVRGTCEWLPVGSRHGFAGPGWECSNCGHEVGERERDSYNCCPMCCAEVRKAVGA